MDTNRLTYLVKVFFENTASQEEQEELAATAQRANGDAHLKKILEQVWEQYEPEQQMPEDMSDRILEKLFAAPVTLTHNREYEIDHVPDPKVKRMAAWRYTAIAASFALVVSLGWWMLKTKPANQQSTSNVHVVSTQKGSRSKVALPDGSTVWLNAGSILEYPDDFGTSLRKVALTGEAFFDVVHDMSKPFIIHTSAFDLKVLGTTFNVRAYPEEKQTEAALITGSLEVSFTGDPSKKLVLKPSEKVSVSTEKDTAAIAAAAEKPLPAISSITYQPNDHSVLETSWVKNKLVFRNKPFDEVTMEMSRWYNVNFEVQDETILKKRFTGTFETETIQEALTTLSESYNFSFSYDKTNRTFIIYK